MVDKKRKRGRKPKTPRTETLELDNTNTTGPAPSSSPNSASDDVVFSISSVEIIDPHHRRPRGRPPKNTKGTSSDPSSSNPKTLRAASPTRLLLDKPNGVMTASSAAENAAVAAAVARVMPAMDAVVKVFCVHTEPNFSLPWQRKKQYSSSSSGFVIKGKRVLTNAHSVEHYTQVKLKKRGSDTKYVATVLAIGTECDIGKSLNIFLIEGKPYSDTKDIKFTAFVVVREKK